MFFFPFCDFGAELIFRYFNQFIAEQSLRELVKFLQSQLLREFDPSSKSLLRKKRKIYQVNRF